MSDSDAVSATPPPEATFLKPLDILSCLGHPMRWQVLQMLAGGQAMTGSQIAAALGKYPDTVNKDLRVMRDAGVLVCEPAEDRRFVAYSVPAAFRKNIGQIDFGFCVLRIAAAMPPVVKD